MNNPLIKLYQWQVNSGQLDGWTSYHIAAGLFIAKVAQWLGASDLWAVLWVLICLLYTSPSPRDVEESRMPSSA